MSVKKQAVIISAVFCEFSGKDGAYITLNECAGCQYNDGIKLTAIYCGHPCAVTDDMI
jgi:hypothetical protein